jgi:hypothetical protein
MSDNARQRTTVDTDCGKQIADGGLRIADYREWAFATRMALYSVKP